MFGPIIKDLHGNIFSIKSWRLYIAIPLNNFDRLIFTKDHLTGISFDLAIKGDKHYAFDFILEKKIYIRYRLSLIGYDESLDIRKSYLYGKKNK